MGWLRRLATQAVLGARTRMQRRRGRSLRLEPLEPRIALAAAGLVDVGVQPDGGLAGKIAYINGGHGYAARNTTDGGWSYGRGLTNGMIEDLGNQDQMTFLADYLFRAGATVVPMRPVGHQPNEVVMDNDDAGVTFTGAWSDSSQTTFFGSAGDVPYRFASTSAVETAVARYTPNLPEAGFYPIYTWALAGSDRTEQLYRINHAGGSTEVTVNHRAVGTGLVYLGTYYFEAGTGGSVEISNRSSEAGRVVIADAIRFGNGMCDTNRGGGISGRPREDELSLYWIKWQVDHAQGVAFNPTGSSLDMNSNVSVVPRYAAFMNREAEGSLSDRVLVSFHSNASGGGISNTRGVLGLYNGNNRVSARTPNQFLLANTLGREVNDDMVAQPGVYEFDWFDSSLVTLDRTDIEFGEINNESVGDEFDATIVEVAYHDNAIDAALMRDPKVRDAVARATYQGLVKYFRAVDGNATPVTTLPGRVEQVRAEAVAPGSARITWTSPAANSYNGDAPTGYRIYGSTNGYAFDGGAYVAGGDSTTFTINGLSAAEGPYYFKVVAVNDGGESTASEVVAVNPQAGPAKVLIVNGFDRLDRFQNPVQSGADRVRPRESNSFDYAVQMASAIAAHSPGLAVESASNELVASGAVNLGAYIAVFWILGEESTANETFSAAEQTRVASYLGAGGKLFVSGAELAFDLDRPSGPTAADRAFLNDVLKAEYVADDAGTYAASAAPGSIFTALPAAQFDNGGQFYNVDFPDRIAPLNGATPALNYSTGGAAGIQYADAVSGSKLVVLGFPFETITSPSIRNAMMARVLDFFEAGQGATDIDLVLDNDDGAGVYQETGAWEEATVPGYNGLTYRFATAGSAATATWQFYAPFDGRGEVFVQYRAASNRAGSTHYSIETGGAAASAVVDQRADSLTWVSLGTYDFTAGLRSVTLDAQASSGGSVVIADAVRIVLTTQPEPSADFNDDGLVDGADFLAWQRGIGLVEPSAAEGDANADGGVDGDDLSVWIGQYGTAGAGILAAARGVLPSHSGDAVEGLAYSESDLIPLAQREHSLREPSTPGAAKRRAAAPVAGFRRAAVARLAIDLALEDGVVGGFRRAPLEPPPSRAHGRYDLLDFALKSPAEEPGSAVATRWGE